MSSDFETPPKKLSLLVVLGAIITALGTIAFLHYLSYRFVQKPTQTTVTASPSPSPSPTTPSPTDTSAPIDPQLEKRFIEVAKVDVQSIEFPGVKVSDREINSVKTPYISSADRLAKFGETEMAIAREAWSYFQNNWNEETGLVNSADGFTSVTLWDQAAAIGAIISAKELGIISEQEFKTKITKMLETLAKMPLYKQELPNKVYNSKTLIPVNYGQINKQEEIGWSAIDIGRFALWLKILQTKYPQFQEPVQKVWKSWQVQRLTQGGNMYGTSVASGKESYNQEGRLGYENYAAYGLKMWGLKVEKAADFRDKAVFVNLYEYGIPYDVRDYYNSQANNYVLSEPYFLDGIETGFQALPKAYSDRILKAQEARYTKTNQLTALTEDNLDRAPYFVYNTLFVNGKAWSTITDKREERNDLRFLSAKAAIGWHVLYNSEYTAKLYEFVQAKLKSGKGWYNGFYELSQEPNKALTANNNGIILESMLYLKLGKPLTVWAGVK